MEETRSMAFASPTEVPPNFITIIGVTSLCPAGARLGEDSSQVSLSL
jgi:hypothetical protein